MGIDAAMKPGAGAPASGARVQGTVLEERPAAVYVVGLEKQHKVLAHLAGAVERNFVRLVAGDRVEVELSPHDPGRGRICRKL